MNRYAVVIEQGPDGYGAYVPDLPGCAAAADTEAEVRRLIEEAIDFHIEGLRLSGEQVPEATSTVDYVETTAGR
ncbi:MAG: type II toxin-antitoxin system HicB family antitoxin [Planctomycetota bacterium]|nr:MAG: type II toxin-antitoxin system HicB family antitoxin [Planctomycetota bacterium]REK30728.1 MAG: type II toxin-antitoxin system HicB family antitoxin [Planctomycetota bacterium]REK33103.1 MAG: type II toxin-antitoxin system HicB family antitoxin [Planctomycetota bacterium]